MSKKNLKSKKISLNLSPEMLQDIDEYCREKYYLTRTSFIIDCIRKTLKDG